MKTKQEMLHRLVPIFEDVPRYPLDAVLELHELNMQLMNTKKEEKIAELICRIEEKLPLLTEKENAPERRFLWKAGAMPSLGTYTENPDFRYNHDPEFQPYMYELLIPETETPKGAVVVCAGGDHGFCVLGEGYQTCLDLNKMGYQAFLLLNRTNRCPYDALEAGADAARAIRLIRQNAAKYRIDENRVAFAGFSNGGLTAEACIQFYSGTQKVTDHFPDYQPDAADVFYGSPEAVLCIYGPRWKNTSFDYSNVVYPPTFFAVGREDTALDNLNATVPDLLAHQVELEVHTFSGVPHGHGGVTIYGNMTHPEFHLWLPLADVFLQNVFAKSVIKRTPDTLKNAEYRFDAFSNDQVLLEKKKNHLPAMGWNSWNAFGSGNTEALTRTMADAMIDLELDKLGYQYLVLDDGCYQPVRVDGRLSNEPEKFPSGFRALGDYIHEKGLKFGMYNDIGTNLCAGAAVGTCGHEDTDAQSYVDWGVDFLKVDNCYFLFDDATFSNRDNAKYVYAPNIRGIRVSGDGMDVQLTAAEGILTGSGAENGTEYVTGIGTYDGTGPAHTPVGAVSSELVFEVTAPQSGEYSITVDYATGMIPGVGSWLQIAVGDGEDSPLFYDDFLPATEGKETFRESAPIRILLQEGSNRIRLMNHRRQENTLNAYAALLEGLKKADPDRDVMFSICEWGKTQPQNWGYKVGDSWRILNDITFQVGADGDPGRGTWADDYTASVTSQYNKAVIMDEFAGLDKGWNDPDMLMVGMDGLTETMYRTHMTMWCMMNSPLMLGLDLRRVQKGDTLWQIIANRDLVALNQDALGIPAKRVACSLAEKAPETEYIRDIHRTDVLAKPLADGSLAISFLNISDRDRAEQVRISLDVILQKLGAKAAGLQGLSEASGYQVKNLWTGEAWVQNEAVFEAGVLEPCDNLTIRVSAVK